jgi:hypothetical protein
MRRYTLCMGQEEVDRELRGKVDAAVARAAAAQAHAVRAHERAAKIREWAQQLFIAAEQAADWASTETRRLTEGGQAAVRQAVQQADRAEDLAARGFEQAAQGMDLSAQAHEQAARSLERRADGGREDSEELLARARSHRANAAGERREAAIDRETARILRQQQAPPEAASD